METKGLLKSGSFWALALSWLGAQDWVPVTEMIVGYLKGIIPADWHAVVDALGNLLLAGIGVYGVHAVKRRSTTIKGLM